MLKLNPQGPQEIRKYPQTAAGHLKYIRERDFTLTKYLEETLRELRVFLQNLWQSLSIPVIIKSL